MKLTYQTTKGGLKTINGDVVDAWFEFGDFKEDKSKPELTKYVSEERVTDVEIHETLSDTRCVFLRKKGVSIDVSE